MKRLALVGFAGNDLHVAKASTDRMIGASELRVFLETAKALNVTRASERLGLSQPALSHALQRIERQLGMVLFQRSKKGLKLTSSGAKLLRRGEDLVREWEQLHRELLDDEEKVAGIFRFGCHPSVGLYTLPFFMPLLQRDYPLINLQVRHGLSRHIAEGIIRGEIDLGIVVNPPSHPDLVIQELMKDEVVPWVATRKKVPDVLICDPDLLQIQWLLRELDKRKILFDRRIETSSLELVRELTVHGCGYGILPGRVAAMSSGLSPAFDEVPGFKDRICLIYRVDTEKTAAFRALIETVRTVAK